MADNGSQVYNEHHTYFILVPFCFGVVQRINGDYQPESHLQCTLVDCDVLFDLRALYFIKCTVFSDRKYYRLCRRHNGAFPFCDNADEFKQDSGTQKESLVKSS